ncbi:glutamate racemase [Niabella sp.]|uniref:glutamate racemase n=1 Tax=Niabella sp. TaxID=1962976 RepID=UPI0026322B99|nr:glutamate racemase [Niabella sp.]
MSNQLSDISHQPSAISSNAAPIGVFDSGYGGLTVLRELVTALPQYDYLYLGDNARAPYGNRSFETVYEYTLQCVQWFFEQGCSLVILACNTASAKALRSIQQNDLPRIAPDKRVLGVIRPTTEVIGAYSENGEIGILATKGTVHSGSYPIEIHKFFPGVRVYQEACPMWVPIVENNEIDTAGADFFIKKNLHALFQKGPQIDAVLLACTHYPLLKDKIQEHLPIDVKLVSQGALVASSLADYLHRHPEMEQRCSKNGQQQFFTTDSTEDFDNHGTLFFGAPVSSTQVVL